jgi:hypothetical protein
MIPLSLLSYNCEKRLTLSDISNAKSSHCVILILYLITAHHYANVLMSKPNLDKLHPKNFDPV